VRFSAGDITVNGNNSAGVIASNHGLGDSLVQMNGGIITAAGPSATGLRSVVANLNSEATATALMKNGAITVAGDNAAGLLVWHFGGGDALAQMDGGTVEVRGEGSFGLYSYNGNAISSARTMAILRDGDVTVWGEHSHGVMAATNSNGDTLAQMDGGSITVWGYSGVGLLSSVIFVRESIASTEALLTGGDIETIGVNGYGIYANTNLNSSGSSLAQMDGGTVTTYGNGAHGVVSRIHYMANTMTATSRLTGGGIETRGLAAYGLYASTFGVGSSLAQIDGGSLTTHADRAIGLFSQARNAHNNASATARLTSGDVRTSGYLAHGAYAQTNGLGATLAEMNGGAITTRGRDAFGLFSVINNLGSDALVTTRISDGDVNTIGGNAHGIAATTTGTGTALISATGGTVMASGENSHGAAGISAGGAVEITVDASVTGGRSNAAGIYASSGAGTSTITVGHNGVLSAYSDRGVVAENGAVTLTNHGTIVGTVHMTDNHDTFTNSSPNSWNIRNFAATVDPTVRNIEAVAVSDFGGGTDTYTNTASGTLRLLTVEDMSGFTPGTDDDTAPTAHDETGIYFAPGSAEFSIEEAGVEQAHLVNLEIFKHAGLITMADAETGGRGPVAGDVFVITGNSIAGGTSGGGLFFSNGGRLHIDTVLNDGATDETDVLVIDQAAIGSGATLVSVTNALPGNGASTDTNGNGVFDANEGILVVQALGEDSPADAFALDGVLIDGAWQYVLDQTDGQSWYLQSRLSPATPVYEALPAILSGLPAAQSGLNRVGTLAQRIEGRQMLVRSVDPEHPHGAWIRVEGERSDVTPGRSTTGVSFDQSTWRLQGGLDMLVHEGENGTWVVGLNLFTGSSSVDVMSSLGNGSISTDAQGVGLTATYYGNRGFYADIQLQYSDFESDLSSGVFGALATGVEGEGHVASIEMGQEFVLSNGMTLTPQAQLMWSDVDLDSFTGPHGETVSLGDNDSLLLRLGLAVEQSWDFGDGEQARLYGIANAIHEMQGERSVLVDGTELSMSAPDWVGEIGIGGSYDRTSREGIRTSLYGEVSASRALSGGTVSGMSGTLGLRIEF
jgi:outer membrane autotransporter protein